MIARKVRLRPLDIIILAVCAVVVLFFVYRVRVKLDYNWNWKIIPRYLVRIDPQTGRPVANYLLQGLFTTVKLSVWATLLATVIGAAMGIFRTSRSLFLRLVGTTYVELVRNLPALVLVFIFYFFISDQIMPLLGVDVFIRSRSGGSKAILEFLFAPTSLFTQFISGILTIAIFEGAFITEIVRSGIESIERGQREAAYVLGLSRYDQMRFVILPQAVRRILPPLASQFISTVKDSAIVAAISIQELTFEGMQLSTSTHLIFEVWITVTLMYLLLTMTLSLAAGGLERRLRRSD